MFLFYSNGSCVLKQSLTIFHLSPIAVIKKFWLNVLDDLSWYLTCPLTFTKNVNWFATDGPENYKIITLNTK